GEAVDRCGGVELAERAARGFINGCNRSSGFELSCHLNDDLPGLLVSALKLRVVRRNKSSPRLHPIALVLHRQINRPVITEICRLLEARRIQATLARENTNILGALVARQPIDVGDDL